MEIFGVLDLKPILNVMFYYNKFKKFISIYKREKFGLVLIWQLEVPTTRILRHTVIEPIKYKIILNKKIYSREELI